MGLGEIASLPGLGLVIRGSRRFKAGATRDKRAASSVHGEVVDILRCMDTIRGFLFIDADFKIRGRKVPNACVSDGLLVLCGDLGEDDWWSSKALKEQKGQAACES